MGTQLGPVPVPAPLDKALPYLKFVVAIVGLVLSFIAAGPFSAPLWLPVAIQAVAAVGVFLSPNIRPVASVVDAPDPVTAAGMPPADAPDASTPPTATA